MTHFINILFFVTVLIGSAAVLTLTLRESWHAILAALAGGMPQRRTDRGPIARVRVTARPRVQVVRAAQRRAAA